MSAGMSDLSLAVNRDYDRLAPRFRQAVESAIHECGQQGLDAFVYEGYRSPELQALYYARGRTVVPPEKPVTNASSNLFSWHGYGLAVDVISRSRRWDVPESWYEQVAAIFNRYDCKWGGDWIMRDLPHFQWGACKASPSDRARQIIATEGMAGVWTVVGAV